MEKTDNEYAEEYAIKQFVQRKKYAIENPPIDNSKLPVGSPMYFYCQECGIIVETLPEDYLFPPRNICSQCAGLIEQGWLHQAILYYEKNK